jgi:hypothetical protein
MMEVEIWILAIVPALAVVAMVDSLVNFSAWLSTKLNLRSELSAHAAVLLLFLVLFLACLFSKFDMSMVFATIDYVRPMDHAFKIEMTPRLIMFDGLSVLLSIGAALLISIRQGNHILLSILAAALGNIGTIVWMSDA